MNEMIPDPTDDTKWIIGSASEPMFGVQVGVATLTNVHPITRCAGTYCVVHNPSDHSMRHMALNWRADTGVMERLCEHGVGHPDPDAVHFAVLQGRSWMGIHGCDGCRRSASPSSAAVTP